MNDEKNNLLAATLSYAKRGWHVLPVSYKLANGTCSCGKPHVGEENKIGKDPMWGQGLSHATKDETIIRRWLSNDPHINVGIAMEKSGLVAIDVDPQNRGDASFCELEKIHGPFPETVKAKSGRGFHLYYLHPGFHFTTGQLAQGVDVKNHGYVIAPPSEHWNGNCYEWVNSPETTDLAELPSWVIEDLKKNKVPEPQPMAGSFLIRVGERNETLFKMAAQLMRAGFSEPHVKAMLLGMANHQCEQPPEDMFDPLEVFHLVESAAKSSVRPERSAEKSQFNILTLDQLNALPPLRWQIKDVIPEKSLVMLFGAPEVGKTFACLDLALTLATDGLWHTGQGLTGSVVYVAAEGVMGLKKRIDAWTRFKERMIENDRFFVHSGQVEIGDEKVVRAFGEEIRGFQPSLIVFDTLSRCTPGIDENSAGAMSKVVNNLSYLKEELGTTVLIIHHTTKNSDIERGSSVLRGAMDTVILAKNGESGSIWLTSRVTQGCLKGA